MKIHVVFPFPDKHSCAGCNKRFIMSLKESELHKLKLHRNNPSELTIETLNKMYNLTFLIYDWNRGETACATCGTVLNEPFLLLTKSLDGDVSYLDDDSDFTEPLIPRLLTIQSKMTNTMDEFDAENSHTPPQNFKLGPMLKFNDFCQATDEKNFIISSIEEIAGYCENSSSSINKLPKREVFSEKDRAKLEEKKSIIALSIRVFTTLCQNFNLGNNIAEDALTLFLIALSSDKKTEITSHNYKPFATACIYQICKNQGIILNLNQLSAVTRVKRKQIWRKLESLRKLLGIKTLIKKPFPYLCKIINEKEELKMELAERPEIIYLAYLIMREAASKEPVLFTRGTSRAGHAAGALYLALKHTLPEKWTQNELASAADVTPVTIRNRQKEYIEIIGKKRLLQLIAIYKQDYGKLGATNKERWETFVKLLFLNS